MYRSPHYKPAASRSISTSRRQTLAYTSRVVRSQRRNMNVLVIDIGGTNVKVLASGEETSRRIPSGRTLTPQRMVTQVKSLVGDWSYDVLSIGYPGAVRSG